MALFSALSKKRYFLTALAGAFFMLAFYPFVQILPQGLNNYWFWFQILTPERWVLYVLYGILFGLTLSFFAFRWRQRTCAIEEKTVGGATGFVGTFVGVILPQCAACVSVAAIFLPASLTFFLTEHTTGVMAASNLLLVGALYSLGAFKRR